MINLDKEYFECVTVYTENRIMALPSHVEGKARVFLDDIKQKREQCCEWWSRPRSVVSEQQRTYWHEQLVEAESALNRWISFITR